jgi:hypothetical protein
MLKNKQNTLLNNFFSFKTNLSGICVFTLVVETKDNESLSKYVYKTIKNIKIQTKISFRASGRNLVNYRSRNRPETDALPA